MTRRHHLAITAAMIAGTACGANQPVTVQTVGSTTSTPETTPAPATPVTTSPAPAAEPPPPAGAGATVPAVTTTPAVRRTVPAAEVEGAGEHAYGEWEIPTSVVMCESRGSWTTYNASGASGPYQLMPSWFNGELAMLQPRAAQHAKAAYLWNGGVNTRSGLGPQNWAACL